MPDITMCKNDTCDKREKCYRYKATPDQYWQSYSQFESDEEDECYIEFVKEK